ncbi:MAG: ribosome biogenesis GTPase Der [Candidatus Melainabacteria bacterium]|nr:MAG: ribosome biogenesis GTPase Der [Candidatus Melainabacteria bacterium]
MSRNIVAIVGRPNVGKSTFFNRCIGARHAIVDDTPGVTRDRAYHETDWAGHEFTLIDTGGIMLDKNHELADEVYDQVQIALEEADVIIFMVDGKAGLTGADKDVANLLRKSQKPVLLAVNKVDVPAEEGNILEFFGLGLGEPHALSALRGTGGVGDLLDKVVSFFPPPASATRKNGSEQEKAAIAIAIVGKPNVGKSSMINVLSRQKRTIVSAKPGTTRDAIDTTVIYQGREITLIDTAGIRRKSKVDYGVEAFSVARSLKAIERADVVVLMLDASEPVSDQDKKIASKIVDAGKAAVVVLNKWDLIENKDSRLMNEFTANLKRDLRALSFAEVLFTSALTRQRTGKILEAVERASDTTNKRMTTSLLNQIINESVSLTPPPVTKRGKRLRIYYATQASTAPPTFILFVNDADLVSNTYEAYLERKLREAFDFTGTPIRLILRSKRS